MQRKLQELATFYKINPNYLEHNQSNFTAWEGAIILGSAKLGQRAEECYCQTGLVRLLHEYKKNYSVTQLAFFLKIKRMTCNSFYQRLLHAENLNRPYLISLGVGIMLSQLLKEDEREALREVLLAVDVPYERYLYTNTHVLGWGD